MDIDRLKRGQYTLEEIVEENKYTKNVLGNYKEEEVFLKSGKYGLYTTYNGKNISLQSLQKDECEITLEDVIQVIKDGNASHNKSIIKEIDNELSIRKGKFGPYVFYKTDKMKKPILSVPLADYIDVGIFTEEEVQGKMKEKVLYLKKHKITAINNKLKIIVEEKPMEVGVDPYNKLIDTQSDDNRRKF